MAVVANVKCWLFFVQLLFLHFNYAFSDSDTCVKKGPCRCEYYNGTIIDLSSSISEQYDAVTAIVPTNNSDNNGFSLLYFYFHPCSNINFTFSGVVESSNKCQQSSLCYRNPQFKVNENGTYIKTNIGMDNYESLGSIDDTLFADGKEGVSIVYKKESITVTVILVCSHNVNTLTVTSPDFPNPVLTYFSPAACGYLEVHYHSFGTTLLIIFLVLVLVYLILGSLVKHFLMGAQGIEVIPNLTFWRDLPNLVRDGIDFIKNGFKPPPQTSTATPGQAPNPNSYDSI